MRIGKNAFLPPFFTRPAIPQGEGKEMVMSDEKAAELVRKAAKLLEKVYLSEVICWDYDLSGMLYKLDDLASSLESRKR